MQTTCGMADPSPSSSAAQQSEDDTCTNDLVGNNRASMSMGLVWSLQSLIPRPSMTLAPSLQSFYTPQDTNLNPVGISADLRALLQGDSPELETYLKEWENRVRPNCGNDIYYQIRDAENTVVLENRLEPKRFSSRIGYGLNSKAAKKKSEIAVFSMSKLATGVVAVITMDIFKQLGIEDRWNEDTNIFSYIDQPERFKPSEEFQSEQPKESDKPFLTVRQCLTHTGGYGMSGYTVGFFKRLFTRYAYANNCDSSMINVFDYGTGYDVIGEILPKVWSYASSAVDVKLRVNVSGFDLDHWTPHTLDDVAQKLLFQPLGMTRSKFEALNVVFRSKAMFGFFPQAGGASLVTTAQDFGELTNMLLCKGRRDQAVANVVAFKLLETDASCSFPFAENSFFPSDTNRFFSSDTFFDDKILRNHLTERVTHDADVHLNTRVWVPMYRKFGRIVRFEEEPQTTRQQRKNEPRRRVYVVEIEDGGISPERKFLPRDLVQKDQPCSSGDLSNNKGVGDSGFGYSLVAAISIRDKKHGGYNDGKRTFFKFHAPGIKTQVANSGCWTLELERLPMYGTTLHWRGMMGSAWEVDFDTKMSFVKISKNAFDQLAQTLLRTWAHIPKHIKEELYGHHRIGIPVTSASFNHAVWTGNVTDVFRRIADAESGAYEFTTCEDGTRSRSSFCRRRRNSFM